MLATRKEKIRYIKRALGREGSSGLEISPSINPMMKREDGFAIEYLDACSTEELRARAISKGRDPGEAPIVNHTLDFQRTIADCVGGKRFDFVLSSHVIEHIPDLIGHFRQIADVLNPGGTYTFLAPDKDLCFDIQKPDTSLGQLIEAHVEKRTIAPLSALIDEYHYAVQKAGKGGWDIKESAPAHVKYPEKDALIAELIAKPGRIKHWHGHIWRFNPKTFKALYQELYKLELVELKLQDVIPTRRMEFIGILKA